MKKIFTLIAAALMSAATMAQSGWQFADKDGNIIPDGSTVVCDEVEDDGFGSVMIPSGIYVKNMENVAVTGSLTGNVESISNGDLQVCFPVNCYMYNAFRTEIDNGEGTLNAGELKSLQAEWVPYVDEEEGETPYGTCEVNFVLKTEANSTSSIKVIFKYDDPTGIKNVAPVMETMQAYDLQGRESKAQKGISIVRMSDGSVKKVLNK